MISMQTKLKKKTRIVALMVLTLFSSCNDLLEHDGEYHHVATQEQHWNSLTDTRSALLGIYGLMRTAVGENNTHWACGDLRKGVFTVRSRNDLQAIKEGRLASVYPIIQQISNWSRFYKVVNAASIFIENARQVVDKDVAYSETNCQYDVAQARALRALAYFYMVRIWGDVPLITESYDNGTFPEVARMDFHKVLDYVKNELTGVITKLPFTLGSSSDKYYGGDANTWNGVLLNRLSVYAILAHIAAWEGNYGDVETYTGYIMDNAALISADYSTTANLVATKGFFSKDYSTKYRGARLVAFAYQAGGSEVNDATVDGHIESWTLAEPLIRKPLPDIYVSRNMLLNLFITTGTSYESMNDERFGFDENISSYYENYVTNINTEYPIFSKIKVIGRFDADTDYGVFSSFTVLSRYEDIVLLRAEALCMLNRTESAIIYLNNVRTNRGLPALSMARHFNNSAENLLKEIFDERRRELLGEGHYWYDQIRRAKTIGDDPDMVELVRNKGVYWPVASDIIKANPMIRQTEYWNN